MLNCNEPSLTVALILNSNWVARRHHGWQWGRRCLKFRFCRSLGTASSDIKRFLYVFLLCFVYKFCGRGMITSRENIEKHFSFYLFSIPVFFTFLPVYFTHTDRNKTLLRQHRSILIIVLTPAAIIC